VPGSIQVSPTAVTGRSDARQPAQSVPEQASAPRDSRLCELPNELRQRARYLRAAGRLDRRAQLDLILRLKTLRRHRWRVRKFLGATPALARASARAFGGSGSLRAPCRRRARVLGGCALGGCAPRAGTLGTGARQVREDAAFAGIGIRGRRLGGTPACGLRAGGIDGGCPSGSLLGALRPLAVACWGHARASSRIRKTGREALA
jgi:hypothetical protein